MTTDAFKLAISQIRANLHREAEAKAKIRSAQKRTPAEAQALKLLEEQFYWQPRSAVLYLQVQQCHCGESYTNVGNIFIERIHEKTGARRLTVPTLTPGETFMKLPHKVEACLVRIPVCPACVEAYDWQDMFDRALGSRQERHASHRQLPLFPNLY